MTTQRFLNPKLCPVLALLCSLAGAFAQGTAFTYQGRLDDNGSPASGIYDLRFTIYDSSGGPGVIAGPMTNSPVAVSNGLFTVTLDPGAGVFTGAERWLEIGVRTNGGGVFTTLSPRQKLAPTPYALFAPNAGTAASATSVAPGAVGTTELQSSSVTSGKIADGTLTAADVNSASFSNTFWKADGNAGTAPGAHFLGTTDNQALELKANNARVLRLEPTAMSPNLIGGYAGNSVAPGLDAVVIAGGGRAGNVNRAGAELTFIGGGWANTNSGGGAFLGGGFLNRIEDGAFDSVLGGGRENVIYSNTVQATISGGLANAAAGGASFAAIGGGRLNTVSTNGRYATIGGGGWNVADAPGATIGGGGVNALFVGANRVHGQSGTIGGGWENVINTNAGYGVIAGGWGNWIQTNTQSAAVGGGQGNLIGSGADQATIGGGHVNSIEAGSYRAAIGGGYQNKVGPDAVAATISGGQWNEVMAAGGTVGGGGFDGLSFAGNKVQERSGTIGGGLGNTIATNAGYATIGGGGYNTVQTNAESAVIGGGQGNEIGVYARYATIAGGSGNQAAGDGAVVGGGGWDGSGWFGGNQALGAASVISGGFSNIASDAYAIIPGGRNNHAAYHAFAAGRRAKAYHGGAFVWADSQDADFASTAANQFNVRASGGARFETSGSGLTVDGQPVFTGTDGSALTSLNASQLASGTVPSAVLAGTYSGALTFNNAANSFTGSGAGLTSLDASQLATGTLPDARLSANVALRNANQTFTGTNQFQNPSGLGGYIQVGTPSANGDPKVISFGDPGYVSIGENLQDDRLEIRARNLVITNFPGSIAVKAGIGREPLVNKLEVEGDASKTTAGSWLANSDARIKQDLQPVTGALEKLDRVNLVSFRYTDDYRAQHPGVEDRRYLNVVAQEFREVFPEHVKSSGEKLPDGSEILQVDTYPLTIYTAAAVQELKRELEQTRMENARLQARLDKFEQLISQQLNQNTP